MTAARPNPTTPQNGTTMTEIAQRPEPKPPVTLNGPLANLDEAWRMAQALAQSALMPDSLRNKPSDVLVTVLYGREIGLAPMQALQTIHVIKGRPFISGQLWLSLVRRAGHRAEVSGDERSATATITRGDTGETHTETFTIEQARTAKLTGNADSNWSKYPDRMLRWRAVANCARMICPEVALGFQAEEEREAEAQQRPTLAQVAQQREQAVQPADEVHDAEVVDDAQVRAQVEQLQHRHTAVGDTTTGEVVEPTDEDWAALNAEAAAQADNTPTGLFGGQ